MSDPETASWQAFLQERFPGTLLARRSPISEGLAMTLVGTLFLLGAALLIGSVVLVTADPTGGGTLTWLGMGALVAGPLAWAGMAAVPMSLAPVPHILMVAGGRWIEVADLTPVPEHPEHFRTKAGALLVIDRDAPTTTATTARQLPEQARAEARAEAERMKSAVRAVQITNQARRLIAAGHLDAARQLVDGDVDEWRLA